MEKNDTECMKHESKLRICHDAKHTCEYLHIPHQVHPYAPIEGGGVWMNIGGGIRMLKNQKNLPVKDAKWT